MQVTLERGGGVTGGRAHQLLGPIDTEDQEDTARSRIEELVAEVDFFEMEDDFPRTGGMSDPTWHSVRVVDGDADRTVRWDANQQISDPLRALRNLCASLGGWEPVE
jgi:hypothetical protein